MGEGRPTVIFEPALGAFGLQWFAIQPQIADLTQTMSYDRAGQAWSDASPYPRTPEQLTTELHLLLEKLKLAPPYVLVAHSFGGLVSRYFAKRFADEVVGMVLVDTSHEMQYEKIKGFDRTRKMMGGVLRLMSLVSRVQFIGEAIASRSLRENRAHIPDAIWEQLVSLAGMPKHHDTVRAEFSHFEQFFGQSSLIPSDFGDLPLIVVTAGESILHQRPVGGFTAEELNQAHQAMQAELAQMSTQGKHVTVPNATHFSIVSNPEHASVVVDAIRELVERVR